jgi:hypothetical protein
MIVTRTRALMLAAACGLGLTVAGCQTVGDVVGQGLTAQLSGAEEVPGPGDPDARGMAEVTTVDRTDNLCYELSVSNIDTATAAHIHRGAAGTAGPPVVPLDAPADGESNGCLAVPSELVDAIEANPAGFYINIHNPAYPNGALRGQLRR